MRRLTWLLVALVWVGCSYPYRHELHPRVEGVPESPEGLSQAFFQSLGVELVPGNRVELVHNGHVFDAIEAEIRAARSSIHILSYIWRPGEPSDRLLRALEERPRGVACRVLVDPLGSIHFGDQVEPRLLAAGCEVRIYRSLRGMVSSVDVAGFQARMHRKIVVRDGVSGLTGGFGIWRSWEGEGVTPEEWRDDNVHVEGPAARGLQQAFAESWQEAGGELLSEASFPQPIASEGAARAGFVGSAGARILSQAERMTLLTMAVARHRLWVANSYFIPSPAIQDMLVEKARQGVDVRVLVPGRHHDIPPVHAGQRATYRRLLQAGVRIFEYEVSMMHSKTLLADERLVVIGSTNMDPLSLYATEEGSLVVADEAVARELAAAYEKDLGHAVEVRWDSWRRRGLLQRLAEKLPGLIGEYL